jgi:tetratricopeptide (TPR) repeat protein
MAFRLRSTRAILAAGVVALVVAGGAALSERQRARPAAAGGLAPTVSGNYLAGSHARAANDAAAAATHFVAALESRPDDPELLEQAVTALILAGQVNRAAALAEHLVVAAPSQPLARLTLAAAEMRAGQWEAARAHLDAIESTAGSATVVPLLRGWAAFGASGREAGLAQLQPLAGTPLGALALQQHAAWMHDAAGDPAAAMLSLEALIDDQQEVWLRLAELAGAIYRRAGAAERALAVYRRYADEHPESRLLQPVIAATEQGRPAPRDIDCGLAGAAEALSDVAGVLARQNNREAALLLGNIGLFLRPDFPALQFLVGDVLESLERWADANRIYAGIRKDAVIYTASQLAIAENLHRLDRFDEASALLRAMAQAKPDDPQPLSLLGDILRRRERFAEAIGVYDEAVGRMAPGEGPNWRLLYARGIALERAKQWPRAEADFLKALELQPDQPFVLNYLGYSWVEQGQNLDRALTMIERAVELRPNDGHIVDSLGWVLYRLGRFEEAVPHLERALELLPQDAVLNDHLGDAYWAVGRQREARFQWRAALNFKPEPDARAAIEQKLQRGPIREASVQP